MTERPPWLPIIIAAIAALPPTIVATAALVQASKTHDLVNSRMTEMLAMNSQLASALATLKEKKAEQVRQDEDTAQIELEKAKVK